MLNIGIIVKGDSEVEDVGDEPLSAVPAEVLNDDSCI
jgi:hypothetical protein